MTPLEKTLRRSITINKRAYVVTLTPEALKITLKGHRIGLELPWTELVSGERALAVALQASVGQFVAGVEGGPRSAVTPQAVKRKHSRIVSQALKSDKPSARRRHATKKSLSRR